MAAPSDGRRVVTPFMPTLLHCASVKMAVQLFREFGLKTLEEAYAEIQHGNLTASQANNARSRKAKANLLRVPAHLRRGVLEAVHGSHHALLDATSYYAINFGLEGAEGSFRFRSDGSIDELKTAQNLVRNAKLDVARRFRVACAFCLVESAEALWAEMVESGEAERLGTRGEDIVSLWAGWLRERPRVTSPQSFVRSLGELISRSPRIFENLSTLIPRLSAVFPLLRPEDRVGCFDLLDRTSMDDLRFCLLSLTNEEEEQMLKCLVSRVLHLHLQWPLQTLFLRTVEKLWDYMDGYCFSCLLCSIFRLKSCQKDYNYSQLFEKFWNMSPPHLRENWEGWPNLKSQIDLYFEEKERKRKYVDNNKV